MKTVCYECYETEHPFNELAFFARMKERPGVFLGAPSLLSLRDQLFGMTYAFSCCGQEDALHYFHLFVEWYHEKKIQDLDGYACWWNHMLYISGHNDAMAFELFFEYFERYIYDAHRLRLPDVK